MADIDDPYGLHQQPSAGSGAGASRAARDDPRSPSSSFRSSDSRSDGEGPSNEAPAFHLQETDEEVQEKDKDRLYALLNIERDATEAQIRDAYRSLAVALHPDKHLDESSKAAAQSRFREIQRAYEILSDAEKRSVYDFFGEEGLQSSWKISVRGKSPDELRAEYERQRAMKRAEEMEGLVKSEGSYVAQIDASSLFAPSDAVPRPPDRAEFPVTLSDRWARVGTRQLTGKHGFETQVTSATNVALSGQMVSRNGKGAGNLIGTLKTQWNPRLFTELSATLMRPQVGSLKAQYTASEFTFFTFVMGAHTAMLPPTLSLTYGRRLSKTSPLTGFATVNSGNYTLGPWGRDIAESGMLPMEPPAVTFGVTSADSEQKGGWTASTNLGPGDCRVVLERRMNAAWLGDTALRAGLSVGLGSGIKVHAGGDRNVTEHTKLGMVVSGGLLEGVGLRLKYRRLGQEVDLPVLLSRTPRPDLFLLSTAVPFAGLFALQSMYLTPRAQLRKSRRLEQLRREHWELIKERRRGAKEGVRVLSGQARNRAGTERKAGGLIVLEAFYGREDTLPETDFADVDAEELDRQAWKRPSGDATQGHEDAREEEADDTTDEGDFDAEAFARSRLYCDVKVPLQALVSKSKLMIPGGRSKSNLLGFYDPAMGEKKVLRVRYLFRGQLHEAIFSDKDAVAMPMRVHQL